MRGNQNLITSAISSSPLPTFVFAEPFTLPVSKPTVVYLQPNRYSHCHLRDLVRSQQRLVQRLASCLWCSGRSLVRQRVTTGLSHDACPSLLAPIFGLLVTVGSFTGGRGREHTLVCHPALLSPCFSLIGNRLWSQERATDSSYLVQVGLWLAIAVCRSPVRVRDVDVACLGIDWRGVDV